MIQHWRERKRGKREADSVEEKMKRRSERERKMRWEVMDRGRK